MTSRRFPGKVLAPFRGRPIIWHVVTAARRALPDVPVVVATTTDDADLPLAVYLESLRIPVFRGSRDDVFERFRACARAHPCDWILRLCADSPLLDPTVLRAVAAHAEKGDCDVATTRVPGSFPKGQNAELVRVAAMMAVDARELTPEDREHVTPFFYRHPERFRIAGVDSGEPSLAAYSVVVDEVADLQRLETIPEAELERFRYRTVLSAGGAPTAGA
jgi:spore coat polysaccharide biosynthesis protein SpsF